MNYAVSEFKPISEPIPHRLPELSEASGTLLSAFCRNGFVVAAFAWGTVDLPEELEPQLRTLVGRKIAILRLDGYHIREA
jgi:hypothetical protein